MTFDKFGVGSLIIGLLIFLGVLQFGFMNSGWTVAGLISAIVVTIEGGLILLGILLMVIGVLLLVL